MKSGAIRAAAFVFGMLVVLIIFHDDRLPFWWQKYSDPGGSFSLEFPSKPRATSQQVKLEAGGPAFAKIVAATPNKTTSYLFMDFNDPGSAGKAVEEVLNGARDGAISKIRGALLDEQRIQFGGHQARDIQARTSQNSMLNIRLIADGQGCFMLTVETAGQKVDSNNVQRFVDSLKLSN